MNKSTFNCWSPLSFILEWTIWEYLRIWRERSAYRRFHLPTAVLFLSPSRMQVLYAFFNDIKITFKLFALFKVFKL